MNPVLSGEVLDLLTEWLPPNEDADRPQIQLATVDAGGRPDIRTVLLTAWDAHGFAFHTDAGSRKAAQLEGNAWVALTVLWPGFTRQLVVRGRAEPQGEADLRAAYAARSPYLRQLAWQNTHDVAALDRDERVRRWSTFRAERDLDALRPAPTWTGYRVRPDRLTFWTSDADGPSHRVEYALRPDGSWSVSHLPG